uniref:Uncharacterized protein n=1 Tax=Ascaris lumbricoides TaxID=6252 RepID=A0A0M3HUL1_ASCLU
MSLYHTIESDHMKLARCEYPIVSLQLFLLSALIQFLPPAFLEGRRSCCRSAPVAPLRCVHAILLLGHSLFLTVLFLPAMRNS